MKHQCSPRIFGSAKDEFTLPSDFNGSDAEIEALFYEGGLFPAAVSLLNKDTP